MTGLVVNWSHCTWDYNFFLGRDSNFDALAWEILITFWTATCLEPLTPLYVCTCKFIYFSKLLCSLYIKHIYPRSIFTFAVHISLLAVRTITAAHIVYTYILHDLYLYVYIYLLLLINSSYYSYVWCSVETCLYKPKIWALTRAGARGLY